MIRLRAGCGVDLQRDYLLMPNAPPPSGKSEAPHPMAAVNKGLEAKFTRNQKRSSENILAPEELAKHNAHSERSPGQATHSNARQKKTIRRNTLTELGMTGGDRILLGPEPDVLQSAERPIAPPRETTDLDDRRLKLETSLHSLNQQVEHLSTALEVSAEAMILRQKLQAAQIHQRQNNPESETLIASSIAPATEVSNTGNWLELLLSALVGGGISGGIVHLLSRRRIDQQNQAIHPNQRPMRHQKIRSKR
ncbi:MAG: hypothetical protein U0989_03825 [Azonexus sp.]|nr:hypothetical protein [Azonexus sp.]MDZ4313881.1 hypothetical protein [Azonexus sp.]